MVEVRLASKEDAAEILEIYAPYILNTTVSFETQLPSIEQFQQRIENCLKTYPWIVAVLNGRVAGYAYASKHREREAYQWTCECSVYMHNDFRGKAIAKLLYELLFQILKQQQFRNVYAGITMPNDASIRFHEKCGFEKFAYYENIGFKFSSWHSVGWWKLQINDYDQQLPPPLKLSQLKPEFFAHLFKQTSLKIQEILGF